jgi:hypothetical protein
MESALAGAGCFYIAAVVLLACYPFVALGRIWLYSKQQVELLREIRDELRRRAQ